MTIKISTIKNRPTFQLLGASAAGAALALFIDLIISIHGSVMHGVSVLLRADPGGSLLGVTQAILGFILIIVGAASIFYFKPLNRKAAFACGFAAIAILALFIP